MMRQVYAAELGRLAGEPRIRTLACALLLLFVTVLWTDWRVASAAAADRIAVMSAERQRWLDQGEKDPHEAAHYGVWAIKPTSPLSILDPGIEPFVGHVVWLEAHQWDEMIFRPRQDGDPLMRNAISVAQIMSLLGPLAAGLLGFAAFAEDRERGTLRLALGNAARPAALLIGRGLAGMTVLAAIVVVPPALLGTVAIATMPDAGWNAWSRLCIWSGLHFVYVTTYLMIGLAISLRALTSRAALVAVIATWALLCVVLPRAATNLSDRWSPLPSYQDVRARAEAEAPVYENFDQWEARRQSILTKWGVATDDETPVNMRGAQLDQAERHSHEVFDRLIGRFHDRVEAQDRLFGRLGVLSPSVALQAAGPAVAGTDFRQHRHFINAAESYRRWLVNRINGEVMSHDVAAGDRYVEGTAFWTGMSAFEYRAPSLGEMLPATLTPLLLLAAWCGVGMLAAAIALRGLHP